MTKPDLEASTFHRPAYRYIRASDRLPSTADARALGDRARVAVKLFNPTGIGTWFITGYDPETRLATGMAVLHEAEVGDFHMGELVSFRGRFGLPLERDLGLHSNISLGSVRSGARP